MDPEGQNQVLVISPSALFSQFSCFSELPFFYNGYNQTKFKIKYTAQFLMRLVYSQIDTINNNSFLQIENILDNNSA